MAAQGAQYVNNAQLKVNHNSCTLSAAYIDEAWHVCNVELYSSPYDLTCYTLYNYFISIISYIIIRLHVCVSLIWAGFQ